MTDRAPATDPLPTIPPLLVTEQHRPVAHYVADAGPLHDRLPRALCGRTFRAACLTAPIGTLCADCLLCLAPARRPAHRWRLLLTRTRGRR